MEMAINTTTAFDAANGAHDTNAYLPAADLKKNAINIAQRSPIKAKDWVEQLRNDTIFPEGLAIDHEPEYYWQAASQWFTPRQVLPPTIQNKELAGIFHCLRNGKILKASSATGGTQRKLLLDLEGGQKVIFKPERSQHYGSVGWDQHHGEIASFHISRLLDMRRAPITVGRRINIANELLPVATPELRDTFTTYKNKTENCFYATCEFCRSMGNITFNPTCPNADGTVEGVMILMLPKQFHKGSVLNFSSFLTPFPISMSFEKNETLIEAMKSKDYCDAQVKTKIPIEPQLLDIVETSIFDFLIQNLDRHTYEFIDQEENGAVMLMDQGKTFGLQSADIDDLEILDPLVKCCILRKKKYEHLQWLSNMEMSFSDAVLRLTSVDVATPPKTGTMKKGNHTTVLREGDLMALDRRMNIVLNALETCFGERSHDEVLADSLLY